MPRILEPRRVPLTGEQIRERANKVRTTRNFVWLDPFPEVYGTKPEKMVYAELIRRGLNFQYVPQINTNIPDIEVNQWFKPDFVLPAEKIIIEVQGAYWHTMPDRIADDSLRFALMQMAGYRVYPWWDYDIETRLMELFDSVPEFRTLASNPTPGSSPGRSTFHDDLAGIRKGAVKHRKPWTHKPVTFKMKKTAQVVKGQKLPKRQSIRIF